MDRLDAIKLFTRVVERGNFSVVAREMNIGQPAVSKQIAALEDHLGAPLLRRTSRVMVLTPEGRDFHESAMQVLNNLEAAESRIGRGLINPSGLVRVTVAPSFGRLCVMPHLPSFFSRYPEIQVELLISDNPVNLIEDGVDIAIHNGAMRDSSLVAKKMVSVPIVTVATPAYLKKHGEPSTPAELEKHQRIVFVQRGATREWTFGGEHGEIVHLPKGSFRSNDGEQIKAATLAGFGLAHTPGWLFGNEIKSGVVRRVLTDFEPAELAISAVWPKSRRQATKVRAFIDFITDAFATNSNLALGNNLTLAGKKIPKRGIPSVKTDGPERAPKRFGEKFGENSRSPTGRRARGSKNLHRKLGKAT
jgi:LysR family transcriptional regulator, regulator for bpeEF and oprC